MRTPRLRAGKRSGPGRHGHTGRCLALWRPGEGPGSRRVSEGSDTRIAAGPSAAQAADHAYERDDHCLPPVASRAGGGGPGHALSMGLTALQHLRISARRRGRSPSPQDSECRVLIAGNRHLTGQAPGDRSGPGVLPAATPGAGGRRGGRGDCHVCSPGPCCLIQHLAWVPVRQMLAG